MDLKVNREVLVVMIVAVVTSSDCRRVRDRHGLLFGDFTRLLACPRIPTQEDPGSGFKIQSPTFISNRTTFSPLGTVNSTLASSCRLRTTDETILQLGNCNVDKTYPSNNQRRLSRRPDCEC